VLYISGRFANNKPLPPRRDSKNHVTSRCNIHTTEPPARGPSIAADCWKEKPTRGGRRRPRMFACRRGSRAGKEGAARRQRATPSCRADCFFFYLSLLLQAQRGERYPAIPTNGPRRTRPGRETENQKRKRGGAKGGRVAGQVGLGVLPSRGTRKSWCGEGWRRPPDDREHDDGVSTSRTGRIKKPSHDGRRRRRRRRRCL
jgi:hypothetical protein